MSTPANAGAPSTFPLIVRDDAITVDCPTGSTTVQNLAGGTVYYSDNPQVSSTRNLGSIAAGGSHTFTAQAWIVASRATPANCVVTVSGSGTVATVDSTGLLFQNELPTSAATVGWNGATNAGNTGTWLAYGAGIDPTGASDSTSALNNLLGNITPGSTVVLPDSATFTLTGTLNIPVACRLTGRAALNFTTQAAVNQAIQVTANGVVIDGIRMFNPSLLNNQVGQPQAILAQASEFTLMNTLIDSFPGGAYVGATGEWQNVRFINNRVKDILGVGNGPVSNSSNGEAGGDGLYCWGAQALFVGNIVNCVGMNWRPYWPVAAGTRVVTFVDNYVYQAQNAGTTGSTTPTWPGVINATVVDGGVTWKCVCLGGDARIGIGHESLQVYEATQSVAHPDALSATNGNVVFGKFRRGIAHEAVSAVEISGNVVADSTWWALNLAYPNASAANNNTVIWTRTANDNQGQVWTPIRVPLEIYLGAQSCQMNSNVVRFTANSVAAAGAHFNGAGGSSTPPVGCTIADNTFEISPLATVSTVLRAQYDSECGFHNNVSRGPAGQHIYRYGSVQPSDVDNRHYQGGVTFSTATEGAIHYEAGPRSISCRGNVTRGLAQVGIAVSGGSGRVESNDSTPVGATRQISNGSVSSGTLTSATASFTSADVGLLPLGINGTPWTASTYITPEFVAIPHTAINGYRYIALTQGNTAATEPTWPTTIGNTVLDGQVLWQCIAGGDLADMVFINSFTSTTATSADAMPTNTPYWLIVSNTSTILVDGFNSDHLAVLNNLAYGRAATAVANVSGGTNGCVVTGNA